MFPIPIPHHFSDVGFLLLTQELGKMIWQKMMQVSGIHDIMECKKFFMKES
ncbi:hypothetical protein [Streptococcus sp. LPB0220]|uniref:hypothetical protein n=1 Tax=Streptococcus sp. LPB0220 TaxID=2610896 RepID=UPI001783F47F|nr:hypothetical protein [Streptococcus sp. LPB0220]